MRRRIAIAVALLLPVGLGAFLIANPQMRSSIALFQQVVQVVRSTSVDSLPDEEIYRLAALGLVRQLGDPYADLLSPEQRASFERNAIGNRYAGTGMTIRAAGGQVSAYRVFPDSPAERAGLRPGDQLVQVDTVVTTSLATDSVSSLLLGMPGTDVLVTYRRAGISDPITTTIQRAVISVAAVPWTTMLAGNVGYIPITRFNNSAAADVARAVMSLERDGATGYILDLRGNGGGDLYAALNMAGLFLESGSEISRVQHRGKPPEIYKAEDASMVSNAPIAVLVDGRSASASEIVAGSLQDHDRALIVGTRTFGKGLVQTQSVLEGGWAIRLTTGKWYTPSGRSIQAEHAGMGDGRFVEDTLTGPERPTYRSTGGRLILGGGGVTPDLVIEPDTVSSAERELARAVAGRIQDLQDIVYEVARHAVAAGGATVPGGNWRDSVYVRLDSAGLPVSRDQFDRAGTTIDRLLQTQVAGLAVGDSAVFRINMSDDRVLQTALDRVESAGNRVRLLGLN